MVHFFGYAVNEDLDPDNSTAFYPLANPDAEMAKTHKGYLEQNENMVDWVCAMTEEEASEIKYQLSDKSKDCNLMSFENSDKACRPMKDYTEKLLYGKSFTDFSSFKQDFCVVRELETMQDFEKLLETEQLVVVDFYATWCQPCIKMAPVMNALCEEMKNVVFGKVDVDKAEEIANSNNVEAMPTFIFYRKGE
jgi:thioredoxin 1